MPQFWDDKFRLRVPGDIAQIMGASTDVGFFMFYHNGKNNQKTAFIKELAKKGLYKMRYNVDFEGTKIILNMRNL